MISSPNYKLRDLIFQVLDSMKKKFRPYEELKKEFESLKMSVKTDMEVMDELFASYQKVRRFSKKNLNFVSPISK